MATDNPLAFDILTCKGGASIAYRHRPGKPQTGNATRPGVIFCGGFNSNMDGTKAGRLDRFCEKEGLAYTRFDYQGHGHSSGRFEDGTIGLWFEDALAVLDKVTDGPQLIVGSPWAHGWPCCSPGHGWKEFQVWSCWPRHPISGKS